MSAAEDYMKVYDRAIAAEARVAAIQSVVDKQAEDEGLWFVAETAPEAYLQQELRKLHGVVEGQHGSKGKEAT